MLFLFDSCQSMSREEKLTLKEQSLEMFHHAFKHYMDHAYPADELMPLSCKGRYRGVEPSRGDIDDVLGNYSLSLIDALDTLVVLGELDTFEDSVKKIVKEVNFDNDIVVSVFEANIRVVGGLLGGHMMADHLKKKMIGMSWYEGELLELAADIGNRLLPAFNTSTGMPYPRVNLRYGVNPEMSRTGQEKDTCTACAGTMLLEFSALSRLTGNMIFEEKASKAMDYLWKSRHSVSDLVGTVINIQNGDWIRKESGVGAGIDSYYEYLLKAYIMLGDDVYLERFNTHYKAVMKYINNGPLMLDVHMHRPQTTARNFMDSLFAFWPGLQVLKGDLKPAIEIHEMLYQVMLRHNFIPEAFTSDFRVHWAQHPLRPEFLESTYFLFKATGDHHYLEVGKKVLENLNKIARVKCGFAAIKDVTTGDHEDQMDSFVFAETFKYLFLLFSEKEDLKVDIDDFIFTTEAHLLPLFLSVHGQNKTEDIPSQILNSLTEEEEEDEEFANTCPSASHLFKGTINYAQDLRNPLKNMVERLCPRPFQRVGGRLRATDFIAGNKEQMEHLNQMGIRLITMNDGRVQLVHISSEAISPEASHDGMLFMQEMIELSKSQSKEVPLEPRVVQFLSSPIFGSVVLKAGPAQFGLNLKNHPGIEGQIARAEPYDGCSPLKNKLDVQAKVVIVGRGGCMFIEKARNIQDAGGLAGIVCDNNSESSSSSSQYFSMSGDGKTDVNIPAVFLFSDEAKVLNNAIATIPELVVYVGESPRKPEEVLQKYTDAKTAVERFAEALEQVSHSGLDVGSENKRAFNGEKAKGLRFILTYLNLQALIPLIQSQEYNHIGGDLFDASQIKVIRQIVGARDGNEINRKIADGEGSRSDKEENDIKESEQKEAKDMFQELMILLQKCTNIGQLQMALEFENKKVTTALARLTEYAYTSGVMKFGVETENLLERLKSRMEVNGNNADCLLSQSIKEKSEQIANEDKLIGDVENDAINSLAKSMEMNSKDLDRMLDVFVEQQMTDLFQQLWSTESEEVFQIRGSSNENSVEDDGMNSDGATSRGDFEGVSEGSNEIITLDSKLQQNLASITCNEDGCFEMTVEEKDPLVRAEPMNEEVKVKEANSKGVELTKKSNCDIPDEAQRRNGGREDDSFHDVPSQSSSAEASADETRISDAT